MRVRVLVAIAIACVVGAEVNGGGVAADASFGNSKEGAFAPLQERVESVAVEKLWTAAAHIGENPAAHAGVGHVGLVPEEAVARLRALRNSMARDGAVRRMLSDSAVSPGSGDAYFRFVRKLFSGIAPVSIVVFGGSVTCGNGLTNRGQRYSDVLGRWLNKHLPVAGTNATYKHTVRNLCTSAMGTSKLQQSIKQTMNQMPTPDLVVLEFAINDGRDGEDIPGKSMEAVVRILLQDVGTAAMMLELDCPRLMYETAEGIHHKVASYYGVPVVSMRQPLRTNLQLDGIVLGCSGAISCPTARDLHSCEFCELMGIRLCTATERHKMPPKTYRQVRCWCPRVLCLVVTRFGLCRFSSGCSVLMMSTAAVWR
jgi:lysophospholipase L1-like esterase